MKTRFLIAVVLIFGVVAAAGAATESAAIKALRGKLSERFPDAKIDSVQPSTLLPGLYEVVTADQIVYADVTGERMVVGQVMDTRTREDLTRKRWNELNKVEFGSLPFDQAIRIVKGDGRRKLALFEDPYCPFCQQLEQNLKAIDNVTIYVFLYPLESLHPRATEAARNLWCAPDRASAWTAWMLAQLVPPTSDCTATPLATLAKLGETLKINSTPTLIFSDGMREAGVLNTDQLEARLSTAAKL